MPIKLNFRLHAFRRRFFLTATLLPLLSPAAKAAPRGRRREAKLRGSAAAEPPQARFRRSRNRAAPARGQHYPPYSAVSPAAGGKGIVKGAERAKVIRANVERKRN